MRKLRLSMSSDIPADGAMPHLRRTAKMGHRCLLSSFNWVQNDRDRFAGTRFSKYCDTRREKRGVENPGLLK